MPHMLNTIICGGSHLHVDDDHDMHCVSPKRSKKGSSNKNPYAGRGLDKFSALLADIQDQKQKIFTQVGADEISIVRFVFSSNDVVKPIVVKLKGGKKENGGRTKDDVVVARTSAEKPSPSNSDDQEATGKGYSSKRVSWNMMNLKKPGFYMPLTMILILVFLAIYGRAFAIMCTSIGWYAIPAIRSGPSSASSRNSRRQQRRKKEYVRRFSEKIVSTTAGKSDGGSPSPKSAFHHAHRKSF